MAEKLSFDPSKLTLGDLADFEDFTGARFQKAFTPKPITDDEGNRVLDDKGRPVSEVQPTAKQLIGLIWIVKRKSDPSFTVDAARNTEVDELEMLVGGGETEGEDESGETS